MKIYLKNQPKEKIDNFLLAAGTFVHQSLHRKSERTRTRKISLHITNQIRFKNI